MSDRTEPNNLELAYLAGYFDGEGCITFTKSQQKYPGLRVTVASGDKEVVERFFNTFGGSLRTEKCAPKAKRQMYRWSVNGGYAQEILKQLLPFLGAKKPQAELALVPDFRIGKVGRRMTDIEREIRLSTLKRIQAINQRVTIELPN